MPLDNAKKAILDALKDLRNTQFHEFLDSLTDSEETPCIWKSEVEENNTRRRVTNLLISRCEESGAVDRTAKTLRKIGCFNEARILESKFKPSSTAADSPSSDPEPGPSSRPLSNQANKESKDPQKVKKRNPEGKQDLGKEILLFSKHKGKSFEWMRKNDVGLAVYVVATHQMERENGNQSQTAPMQNKDALAEYVSNFTDVVEKVHFYKEGLAPVGFGKYEHKTRKDLYNSKDEEEKSYVNWLRSIAETAKVAQTKAMIQYILHRDQMAPVSTGSKTVPPRPATMKRAAPPSSRPAAKKQWI